MTSPESETGDREVKAWLDGLADRPGDSAAHAEGRQLREALMPGKLELEPPPWSELEARAARPEATRSNAANAQRWGRMAWLASMGVASVVGVAVWAPWAEPGGDPQMPTLRGAAGSTAATWLTINPRSDAERLAADLRSLGATVDLKDQAGHIVMSVRATAERRDAVNLRLAALETALDASGSLTIKVQQGAIP